MSYAELHCLSNFSFLRGASHPEELVEQAQQLGYRALSLTDECSLAGTVRAHVAAKACSLPLIIGSEIRLVDGPNLVILATDRESYGHLAQLITHGRRAADKGNYRLTRVDLENGLPGCLALWLPDIQPNQTHTHWLRDIFPDRIWIAAELLKEPNDRQRLDKLMAFSKRNGIPLVAAGNVHMHVRERRILQDTLTAIRLKRTVAAAGHALHPNGERYLRSIETLKRIYPPELLKETLDVAERCRFSLDSLRYEYPEELVPPGTTPKEYLRTLTQEGLKRRFPNGVSEKVKAQIEHELALIASLNYEAYFLTVYDIVQFARKEDILCQGRGSAANSAVCYCLGITAVDPAHMEMLFERFISRERNEPPDIDVDFEHDRREEVMQYVFQKYGRDRAALAATVITYRLKSALRDAGKALGLELAQIDRLTKSLAWWDKKHLLCERLKEAGFDPDSPQVLRLISIVNVLVGFPRHLSQHVGGFVISRGPLSRLVPIENATMVNRTVIQWDKDDLDALGLMKVDCLALGMLSTIRRALALISAFYDKPFVMTDVPQDDPKTYEMIQRADTVGVFQIESRAQMAMLPRIKPKIYYDLVIQVAIVRPGPIQGGMVHPYLRRRQGLEKEEYPFDKVKKVLSRTLGIPIFQEQAMQLAIEGAGFTPGEADRLRRSMAAWRRKGGLEKFEQRLISGMIERGCPQEFAQRVFKQIQGFGEYGFPESHAASFALLAYISAWLKCHEPAAFTCALLNSQPMGFYSPAQLINDARRHNVKILPVDVIISMWDCTLEKFESKPVIRLGLRRVKGLSEAAAKRIAQARDEKLFSDVTDLAYRAKLDTKELNALANSGALNNLVQPTHHRRQARWSVAAIEPVSPLALHTAISESSFALPPPSEAEEIITDYASLGLTLGRHPLALLRKRLDDLKIKTAEDLHSVPHGRLVKVAGIVTCRQRPATKSGVVFLTLEDETGMSNIVVWQNVVDKQRRELLGANLLGVYGKVEREGEVIHIIASKLVDYTSMLGNLAISSRDFH